MGAVERLGRNFGIDDRFSALLLLYERFRADEEFRLEILGDFEGKPISSSVIRRRLREIGDAPPYRLAPRPQREFLPMTACA